MINRIYEIYYKIIQKFQSIDFLLLLGIRLYLVPTMFVGARSKVEGFSTTVAWFGAPASQGGLGMPISNSRGAWRSGVRLHPIRPWMSIMTSEVEAIELCGHKGIGQGVQISIEGDQTGGH